MMTALHEINKKCIFGFQHLIWIMYIFSYKLQSL